MDEIVPVVWILLFWEQIATGTFAFYCEDAAVSIPNLTRTLVIDILDSNSESEVLFPLAKLSSSEKKRALKIKEFHRKFCNTSNNHPNLSEHCRRFPKINEDHQKLAEDLRTFLEVSRRFSEMFERYWNAKHIAACLRKRWSVYDIE